MSGCAGWQAVNPLCRIGQVVGGAAKSVGSDVFGSIADYFAGVAKSAVSWLWDQLNTATSIDLSSPSIKSDILVTGGIAALITFALFLIQVIGAALRQELGGLGRAVRGLGIAFIGAAFAIASTQILLTAVDGLCNGVVHFALGTDMQGLGTKLITAATLSSIGNPAGLLLISLVLIGAVVVVWVALMIRKMLIIVSAVFAPVAFSGAASDVSRSWVRRWIEFTVGLVFSKLILVIIFMIGLSVLNGAGETSPSTNKVTASVTSLVIGALTLLLAGFAPWIAIKMVHFAGESLHVAHAQAATAGSGAKTVVAAPTKVAMTASRFGAMTSLAKNGTAKGAASSVGQPKSGSSRGGGGNGGGSSGPPGSSSAPRAPGGSAFAAARSSPPASPATSNGHSTNGRPAHE